MVYMHPLSRMLDKNLIYANFVKKVKVVAFPANHFPPSLHAVSPVFRCEVD